MSTGKLRFKDHYQIEILEDEKIVLIVTEKKHLTLTGKLYVQIVPYVNGKHTKDEIVDTLCDKISIPEIYYALNMLEKNGHLTEFSEEYPACEQSYWSEQGIDLKKSHDNISGNNISIISFDCPHIDELEKSLQELGLNICNDGDIVLVVTDDYLRPEISELNKQFQKENKRWFVIKPLGVETWIGPLIKPGDTSCFECVSTRLKKNLEVRTFINGKRTPDNRLKYASIPSTVRMTYQMTATCLAKMIMFDDFSQFEDKMISIEIDNLKIKEHKIVKEPHCEVCGDEGGKKPVAPQLTSRVKTHTHDGGHRTASPEDTYKKYAHHVSHLTGAVKFLEPVDKLGSDNIHVYLAGHNMASRLNSLDMIKRNMRSSSSGKGASEAQAKTGGLCEALERYSGIYTGNEYSINGSYAELGKRAIHPNDCMRYSDRQYEEREQTNQGCDKFNHVPKPFDNDEVVQWSPVWSLSEKEFKYLPSTYCYYSHPEANRVAACSNGCAAGASLEDAVLQGFFELVERDCVALWWYNMLPKNGIDLNSFDDPYIKELTSTYKNKKRDIWALDLTSDLGIPCFAALSKRTDSSKQAVIFGLGCHLDPKIAMLRALTEMNQFLTITLDIESDTTALTDEHMKDWIENATVENQPYLAPDPTKPSKKMNEYPDVSKNDLLDDIDTCRNIVEAKGMEMLILDQTRKEIGMPVVKVFVPGLRHFWKRLAPGRLYDIPVEMGWLDTPRNESEMNPTPIFI